MIKAPKRIFISVVCLFCLQQLKAQVTAQKDTSFILPESSSCSVKLGFVVNDNELDFMFMLSNSCGLHGLKLVVFDRFGTEVFSTSEIYLLCHQFPDHKFRKDVYNYLLFYEIGEDKMRVGGRLFCPGN